jgi:alanyl-tRNA synthetase
MTRLLYLDDSYMKEFDAEVTDVDGRLVRLDQTCFYPLGGGQPGDTGVIVADGKEYRVIATAKRGPDVIQAIQHVMCCARWSMLRPAR